ncbi:Macrophage erythroblast attacher [Operophtera brumata]|uniref:E3 ubiquitin-protein transferase MAEA n=1 Tax=Operophtera brumata TaxID=104452 RepID=A0A0L7LGH8_OPEBR|nr:Macrophage erythroblast attacher [Operophtera brumata]
MKRKASEAITEEVQAAMVCKKRLEHLKEQAVPLSEPATPQIKAAMVCKKRLEHLKDQAVPLSEPATPQIKAAMVCKKRLEHLKEQAVPLSEPATPQIKAAMVCKKRLEHLKDQAVPLSEPATPQIKAAMVCKKRLEHLKEQAVPLSEPATPQIKAAMVCKKRLEHLKEQAVPLSEPATPQIKTQLNQWRKVRLDRMLVDYFLRNGHYDSAKKLADARGLRDLTNVDIYLQAAMVERELCQRRTARCLQWCNENKSKLKKINSNMEFNIRVQVPASEHNSRHTHIVVVVERELCQRRTARCLQWCNENKSKLKKINSNMEFNIRVQVPASEHNSRHTHIVVVVERELCQRRTARCLQWCNENKSKLKKINSNMEFNIRVQALKEMMKEHGSIICPKTKEAFCMKRVEKVYVM